MRFAIINGLPYVISGEMAIPVEIRGGAIRLEHSQTFEAMQEGVYVLREIVAKFGDDVSSIAPVEDAEATEAEEAEETASTEEPKAAEDAEATEAPEEAIPTEVASAKRSKAKKEQ